MAKIKTYRQLLDALKKLDDEQLDCDLTIVDGTQEYIPVQIQIGEELDDDVLDEGHPYLEIESHSLESLI